MRKLSSFFIDFCDIVLDIGLVYPVQKKIQVCSDLFCRVGGIRAANFVHGKKLEKSMFAACCKRLY